ncbi:Holliday junction resolvase RuvX [Oscillochloris sp. ZM17-4]|uniref:Holliday junction resolvase RuvX n=1 Tax=Oscillochloris sp. ZM17-4 TaxID=2866714 RepID=UPI001C72BC0A|nr:Holliday junction resolvase RuvX [Oscillochloris sp. ZM17-4]MBX0329984.1 Holliday junction resolvase RuvX [Oscillochloris sp. ZM17-4]
MVDRRVLGLDVGARRIGVALSDASGVLSSPLTTISAKSRERALAEIGRLVREHEVVEVVAGLPLTLRGEVGPQAELISAFARELESALAMPVALFDERLSTAAAEQMLRDLGVKPEKRKQQIEGSTP